MELTTLDEAAQRLGVHVTTLRRWIREGRVPAYRLGSRFVRVDWKQVIQAISREGSRRSPTDPATARRNGREDRQ